MIIDVHTHFFGEEAAEDPEGFAHTRGEAHWLRLVRPERGAWLQGFVSPEQFLSDMDAAGVDQSIVLGWYWEQAETCALQNRWIGALAAQAPERFIPFASAHPLGPDDGLRGLREAAGQGFRGIGELCPGVSGPPLRDRLWKPIFNFAQEQGWPVNLHLSEAAGRPHAGRVGPSLDDVIWLARAYPGLKLILAHWGGGLPFFELNPYVRESLSQVVYDSAASPLMYGPEVFSRVRGLVGVERMLYGSDYPLRLYPKQQTRPDFVPFLEEVRGSGFSAREGAAFLGENTRRILDA